ncbi:MAG TPA: TIR domain-containing protein [Blastocatellia bacterium]|nr:TIR domain-containing protein [Blastocatellia bacterium]
MGLPVLVILTFGIAMSENRLNRSQPPSSDQQYDAFLSHNSQDKPAVELLARKLEDEAGLKTWLDKWNLIPGDPWQEAIEEALTRSLTCVVFLGPSGFGAWHHEEMRNALDLRVSNFNNKLRVIPVLLPGSIMPERSKLPSFLARLTWVDFRAGLENNESFHRLVAGIRRVVPGRMDITPSPVVICPYRGLEVFDEAHAPFFFGREAMTQHLVETMRQTRFLAVLGPSGSGKSSLARAGLLPKLRAGALPFSNRWKFVKFRPGYRPIEALATCVLAENISAAPVEDLIERLSTAKNGLHLEVQLYLTKQFADAEREKARCVILVDQFEEIFTLCQDEQEKLKFIENLRYAGFIEGGQTVIVLTMRADFLPQAAQYVTLAEIISDHQFLVSPFDEADIRRVIEEPALAVGLRFESGLVERILSDFGNEPGTLPLLEDALLQLYEHRSSDLLTQQAYDQIGGVKGALAKRAEDIYNRFTPKKQEITRRLLLRLTQPGDGTADTRRRATRAELWSQAEERQDVDKVIEALTKSRLISISKVADGPEQVDVAHEALIRGWPRLGGWINEDRAGLRLHRRLTEAAMEWERDNRAEDYLYRGLKLAQAVEWRRGHEAALNEIEREFLNASVGRENRADEEEKERQQRELEAAKKIAETETHRAETERKSRLRLRWFSIILLILLLGAVSLAMFAIQQRNRANENAKRSTLLLYAANLNLAKSAFDEKRWMRGFDLLEGYIPQDGMTDQDDLRDFYWRHLWHLTHNEKMTLEGKEQNADVVAFTSDGKILAMGNSDGTVILWDVKAKREISRFDSQSEGIESVRFLENDNVLASSSITGKIELWNIKTEQEVTTFNVADIEVTEDENSSVVFSPDGRILASTVVVIEHCGECGIDLWDIKSGKKKATLKGHTQNIYAMAFSPDGKTLASGSADQTIKIWDLNTGHELATLRAEEWVRSITFSPDGKVLASGGMTGTVSLWDVRSHRELVQLKGHSGIVRVVEFSADGKLLASGCDDATIKLWDVQNRQELRTLKSHIETINSIVFSPDRNIVASASGDGCVKLWEIKTIEESTMLKDHKGQMWHVAFSPDGQMVAGGTEDGSVVLWDVKEGHEVATFSGHDNPINVVAFSPDSKILASGDRGNVYHSSKQGRIKLWNVQSGREFSTLIGHTGAILSLAFSSDGKTLASGDSDNTIIIWNVITGHEVSRLAGHKNSVSAVAFSPDDRNLLSAGDDGTIKIWDVNQGLNLMTLKGPDEVEVYAAAFSPRGDMVASGGKDKTIRLWDVRSRKEVAILKGHEEAIRWIVFAPDGKSLASASSDGTVKLWDARSGQELVTLHKGVWGDSVHGLSFTKDGRLLNCVSSDWVIRFYYAATDEEVANQRTKRTEAHLLGDSTE